MIIRTALDFNVDYAICWICKNKILRHDNVRFALDDGNEVHVVCTLHDLTPMKLT